ncbi:MAG TPA: DUF2244 domain-containing protein [Candidatus Competibacter sp.]|nr:DUF2244 domain-containing protein [Candidatus Competibacteraceae bacterium]HRC71094.1 DUF2244 domain-containing protein [Candidatus Competibacter sp.]
MVAVECGLKECQYCYVLRPNRSLTWRQNLLFLGGLSGVTLVGMAPLVAMGFWPVLPFAGLELLVVGIGLYRVMCRCHECEVIYVAADSIRIERGRRGPRQSWVLTRAWTQVVLKVCPRQWYPSRLLIRGHGRSVEVGRFLVEEERKKLARDLARCLRGEVSGDSPISGPQEPK